VRRRCCRSRRADPGLRRRHRPATHAACHAQTVGPSASDGQGRWTLRSCGAGLRRSLHSKFASALTVTLNVRGTHHNLPFVFESITTSTPDRYWWFRCCRGAGSFRFGSRSRPAFRRFRPGSAGTGVGAAAVRPMPGRRRWRADGVGRVLVEFDGLDRDRGSGLRWRRST